MLALRTGSEGRAVLDTAAGIPARAPGEALIKVLRAGICNTDLEILRGYMGFQGILGHEFVGVVSKRTCSVRNRMGRKKHESFDRRGDHCPLVPSMDPYRPNPDFLARVQRCKLVFLRNDPAEILQEFRCIRVL